MFITICFAGFMCLAASVALLDWRRGWLLAIVATCLQDPARKLTPGTPVVMTFSVILIYIVILFAAQSPLQREFRDLSRRFPNVYGMLIIFLGFLALAAVNGLGTYGVALWKVPALSLFIYTAPLPAILLGYTYAQREEQILQVFRFYAVVTTIGLIGTPFEFLKFDWAALGMVGLPEGFIRHLPGLQIRLLSGFYRAPDIMGWHAAMLAIIGIAMALRTRVLRYAWPWILVAGWGFLNAVLSGRRKAVYMVAAFVVVFVWRYMRRLTIAQSVSFGMMALVMVIVMYNLKSKEESSVYAAGTETTFGEVMERLEGGVVGTVEQFGFLGAGLGTATQGVRHLLQHDENIGWQEGGLGKLAIEVGVPGLLAALGTFIVLLHVLMKVTAFPDEEGSTQLVRCVLFGIFLANVANFMASAQAYSDAGLTLMTCFFLGCLLATATHNERLKNAANATPELDPRQRVLNPATAQ
jgi:Ca2+/Na+ antiporter